MKTYAPCHQDVQKKWYLVDAEGQTLGRLASRLAMILRGKHKPSYAPYLDMGDYVIVINAEKVKLTGNKKTNKIYYWHTGYPGGIRSRTAGEMLQTHPERVIHKAVWGMLPKNKLRKHIIKKLKVYTGPEHPHQAQQPEPLKLER